MSKFLSVLSVSVFAAFSATGAGAAPPIDAGIKADVAAGKAGAAEAKKDVKQLKTNTEADLKDAKAIDDKAKAEATSARDKANADGKSKY